MRIANTVKLNLSKMEFKNSTDKSLFLQALDKTYFTWVKAMIARVEKGIGRNEILTIDLNDPPFAKNSSFMENAERLCETLAVAEDTNLRRAVVKCIYANIHALKILLKDQEESIREIAEKRLSGTSNMWASKSGRISTAFIIDKNIFWMYNWYSFYIKVFGIWCRSYLSSYLEFYTGSYGQQTESHTREAI